MRASGRSTLLIATIGRSPIFNALPTTNFVCGIGPSAASTSTITPSTIERMRSTSPPKSAWPGVSTILTRVSFHTTEVALARMVMPRSFSRSFEVHRPLLDPLVVAERAGLRQQLVDERRLAVVDVGDDGDVAQLHGVSEASRTRHGINRNRGRPRRVENGFELLRRNIRSRPLRQGGRTQASRASGSAAEATGRPGKPPGGAIRADGTGRPPCGTLRPTGRRPLKRIESPAV